MSTDTSIIEAMQEVERTHLVTWNGRKYPQPVVEVRDPTFEVVSWQGSRFRFFTQGTDAPYLTNLSSATDYDIDEFAIVGELYDLSDVPNGSP